MSLPHILRYIFNFQAAVAFEVSNMFLVENLEIVEGSFPIQVTQSHSQ